MFRETEVLAQIKPGDRVLDVGGWACPFNRADWILDCEPYETRGYYKTIGMPPFQGGEQEHFTRETWIERDICHHEPWPFPDKFFDYAICSHTLEDIRDPLFVCSELVRVAKRGYIETPSRLAETCRGWETDTIAGLSHHRWLIEYGQDRLEFWPKYHLIHSDPSLNLPPEIFHAMTPEEHISSLFWEGSFEFRENGVHGTEPRRLLLEKFVQEILTSERFKNVPKSNHDRRSSDHELEHLRSELRQSALRLDAAHAQLAGIADLGPISLGIARRLRKAATRYPRVAGTVKPLVRWVHRSIAQASR